MMRNHWRLIITDRARNVYETKWKPASLVRGNDAETVHNDVGKIVSEAKTSLGVELDDGTHRIFFVHILAYVDIEVKEM